MKALYDCAQFRYNQSFFINYYIIIYLNLVKSYFFYYISPECCVISLVYINRLIAFTGMPLNPTNWRPLILCSLLVAQKVNF